MITISKQELKTQLDRAILSMSSHSLKYSNMVIYVGRSAYEKARYSCTTDEEDFKLKNGRLTYKGFKLTLMP